jgi:TRAP-type C4-dicarboxylate transport system permease small subunit
MSLMYGRGHFHFYSVAIGASVGGLLVATVGVLISLSPPTVRQAYQRLSIALLLAFLPVFCTQYLPATLRATVLPAEQSWLLLALAAGSALALLDWWVLAVDVYRFQRARLVAKFDNPISSNGTSL